LTARILVVDDQRSNVEMMAGVLKARGYAVHTALDGQQALDQVREIHPDLVVSDILMPGVDGYDLCRRLRSAPETALLPLILVTSLDGQHERIKGLEAGADDFLSKPVNWEELFARVRSLLRVKALQDELKDVNAKLAERVRDQVSQLERLSRLKRFFSKPVAEAIVAGGEELLEPHRREITAVFLDLRGFTSFTDRADPDEVMELLRTYHATLGRTVDEYGGTLEHFAGDGMMIFFNDPVPQADHVERAVRMAVAMREEFADLAAKWARLGYELGFGVGIATGYATLGRIGFEGRYDYGMVGAAVIVASRLSSAAEANQILLNPRAHAAVEQIVEVEEVGPLTLKGFARPLPTVNVRAVREGVPA